MTLCLESRFFIVMLCVIMLNVVMLNVIAHAHFFHSIRLFYPPPSWGLYYKTLRTCNVQKMVRLCNKLVSSLLPATFTSLDKHISLLHNLYIFCALWVRNVLQYRTLVLCNIAIIQNEDKVSKYKGLNQIC